MTATRIIETAIDENGDSYIYSDKSQNGWDLAGHTITDLYFSRQCPPDMLVANQEINDRNFNLKPGEIRVIRSDICPTRPIYENLPADEKPDDIKKLFYHSTTTVDYVIVLTGELVMIVGEQEVIVRAGDVIIQRGAAHAWHNYTDETASFIAIMIGTAVPNQFERVDTVQPD